MSGGFMLPSTMPDTTTPWRSLMVGKGKIAKILCCIFYFKGWLGYSILALYSFNPDPRSRFLKIKNEEISAWKKFKVCWPKNCITCILSSPEGLPSNRRSLEPSKEKPPALYIFSVFSFLRVFTACFDPDSQYRSGSTESVPIRIRFRNFPGLCARF